MCWRTEGTFTNHHRPALLWRFRDYGAGYKTVGLLRPTYGPTNAPFRGRNEHREIADFS